MEIRKLRAMLRDALKNSQQRRRARRKNTEQTEGVPTFSRNEAEFDEEDVFTRLVRVASMVEDPFGKSHKRLSSIRIRTANLVRSTTTAGWCLANNHARRTRQVIEVPAKAVMRSDNRRSRVINRLLEFATHLPDEEVHGQQDVIDKAIAEGADEHKLSYPPTDARPGPLIDGGGRASEVPDEETQAFTLGDDIPGDLLALVMNYIVGGELPSRITEVHYMRDAIDLFEMPELGAALDDHLELLQERDAHVRSLGIADVAAAPSLTQSRILQHKSQEEEQARHALADELIDKLSDARRVASEATKETEVANTKLQKLTEARAEDKALITELQQREQQLLNENEVLKVATSHKRVSLAQRLTSVWHRAKPWPSVALPVLPSRQHTASSLYWRRSLTTWH